MLASVLFIDMQLIYPTMQDEQMTIGFTDNKKAMKRSLHKKWYGYLASGAAIVVVVIALTIAVSGFVTRLPGDALLPNDERRNQAFYIGMTDGVEIAVDLWFPPSFSKNQKTPTLLHMTRYWRATETSFLMRALMGLGFIDKNTTLPEGVQPLNQAGYAVLLVDARGSGASYGHRVAELAPREIADYGELVDWIVKQPWSDGQVGAYGVSYNGITAEQLLSTKRTAVKAVAPMYADFDFQLGVMQPGGVTLDFIDLWSDSVHAMDANDICGSFGLTGLDCLTAKWLTPSVKPVDNDHNKRLLQAAIANHIKNIPLSEAFADVRFRDDPYGDTSIRISDLNSYSKKDSIETHATPMQVWLGWHDANTVNGGLSRFVTFSNPQDVIIGPFSHGGQFDTNPLLPAHTPVTPSLENQYDYLIRFFDKHFKTEVSTPEHMIKYYTYGADQWCQTSIWPPLNMETISFYLNENSTLTASAPQSKTASDTYKVDYTHTTGVKNRWFTNLDYGDVIYPDQTEETRKLLPYTSKPLTEDTTITGAITTSLYIASTHAEAAFHIYLQGVRPDNSVYYITEGVLHSDNHQLTSPQAPSELFTLPRSYLRKDAKPIEANKLTQIDISLSPISIRIPKGHSLRLAIGGADVSIFPRIPNEGNPVWTVAHNTDGPSRINIPVEKANSCMKANPFLPETGVRK